MIPRMFQKSSRRNLIQLLGMYQRVLMLKTIMKLMRLLIQSDKQKSSLVTKKRLETGTQKETNGITILIIESLNQRLPNKKLNLLLIKVVVHSITLGGRD